MAVLPTKSFTPPGNAPITEADGYVSQTWGAFFQALASRMFALEGVNGVLIASPSYADDAAAAAGGVLVGHLYRNGSAVMVRVV